MAVEGVSGASAAADVQAAIEEALGAHVYQFAMSLSGQGNLWKQTAEQAFGQENQLEKAKNIDIA